MKEIKAKSLTSESPSREKWYPSLHLTSEDLSEIKNWEVGKTYKLVLEVKQTSKAQYSKGRIDGSFDVKGIEVVKNKE